MSELSENRVCLFCRQVNSPDAVECLRCERDLDRKPDALVFNEAFRKAVAQKQRKADKKSGRKFLPRRALGFKTRDSVKPVKDSKEVVDTVQAETENVSDDELAEDVSESSELTIYIDGANQAIKISSDLAVIGCDPVAGVAEGAELVILSDRTKTVAASHAMLRVIDGLVFIEGFGSNSVQVKNRQGEIVAIPAGVLAGVRENIFIVGKVKCRIML